MEETNEKLSLKAAMAAEIMVGFWFGIGAILAVKVVCVWSIVLKSL